MSLELRRLYEETLLTSGGTREERYGGERPFTIL